jgi:hypothetical protein
LNVVKHQWILKFITNMLSLMLCVASYIGIEIDGPTHFVTNGKRALGHTVLKYRMLKHQGWIVVRVPYYEFDKIPIWATMERQRYLQRLLKTHPNLTFSSSDRSQYKALAPNRKSRYD